MIVILGPTPCHTCGTPVTIVRRTVEQPCDVCNCGRCEGRQTPTAAHTHTLPDVGPYTTVDEDGTRHECGS